jgi:hypothetical protein
MVRTLRNAGCDVTFTVFADVDHDVWNHCLDEKLWHWILSHRSTGRLDRSVELPGPA